MTITRSDRTRDPDGFGTAFDDDHRFMGAALALGRRGLGRAAPNPSVGALVVRDGVVVGRGWTGDGGRPHGEALALAQAGAAAQGATIYVTLEPCSHHGRTPPCCKAIVAAGIARLVYALDDPNPMVAGQGAAFCRANGVLVRAAMRAAEAARDHRGHVLRMTQARPAVTLKLAETADGFVAGGVHDPRLSITGAPANGAVHAMRAMHDAIMVGIGTVLADDPLMTVRIPGSTARPLRVVLDNALRTPDTSRLVRTAADAPVLIMTSAGEMAGPRAARLQETGVAVVGVPPAEAGGLDLFAALAELARRGVTRVFSEGGPSVGSALIAGGFADDVVILTAPKPLAREGVATMTRLARARLLDPAHYILTDDHVLGVDRLRRYEKVS